MIEKEMSRQLGYYYRNKEKINKKFAEKYRNNIEFRETWKEKNKNEQKRVRNNAKILTELEKWLKERQDYAYEYENVLDKMQKLKEKYK